MTIKNSKSDYRLSKPHLLSIEDLSRDDIMGLLDLAEQIANLDPHKGQKKDVLKGLTQINLFF